MSYLIQASGQLQFKTPEAFQGAIRKLTKGGWLKLYRADELQWINEDDDFVLTPMESSEPKPVVDEANLTLTIPDSHYRNLDNVIRDIWLTCTSESAFSFYSIDGCPAVCVYNFTDKVRHFSNDEDLLIRLSGCEDEMSQDALRLSYVEFEAKYPEGDYFELVFDLLQDILIVYAQTDEK